MNTCKVVVAWLCISAMLLLAACASDEKPGNGESATSPDDKQVEETVKMPPIFLYDAGPSSVFHTVEMPDSIAKDLKHKSVIGYVYIQFRDQMWRPGRMDAGDSIVVHLPDDLKLEAGVRRIRKIGDLVSITADVHEPHHGFVSLTQEKNRIVGTIEVYSENRTFHIRYDRHNDMLYLAEVDPAKLDIVPESPPLEPPFNDEGQFNQETL